MAVIQLNRMAASIRLSAGPVLYLGHFIFVYIHPYMGGNGRIGRFLMNTMMASGEYPWTVIPVTDRDAYVNALEKSSVGEDIASFADFLAGLVKRRLAGEPLPAVPKASPVNEH
jgi:Fic family protein